MLLVFDDSVAYGYINEDRAGGLSGLKHLIEEKIGKEMDIEIRKNESTVSAQKLFPDIRRKMKT